MSGSGRHLRGACRGGAEIPIRWNNEMTVKSGEGQTVDSLELDI